MSGWRHTAPHDLHCRKGPRRPPMKKGTTLFRGSALDPVMGFVVCQPYSNTTARYC